MSWGGGSYHTPKYVAPVVKAWKEGREKAISKSKSNEGVSTRGGRYYVYGHLVAVRRDAAVRLKNMTDMIVHGTQLSVAEYSFSFAGWPTKMTANHLNALGIIRADCYGIKDPKCYMNGKLVDASGWYSLEEIAELMNPPPKPKRVPREPVFVNLTRDLFDLEACAC